MINEPVPVADDWIVRFAVASIVRFLQYAVVIVQITGSFVTSGMITSVVSVGTFSPAQLEDVAQSVLVAPVHVPVVGVVNVISSP